MLFENGMKSTEKHYATIEFVSDCDGGGYFFYKLKSVNKNHIFK